MWNIVFNGHHLLFNNPDLVGRNPDTTALADLPTRSPQFGFPLWGGEKTWIAPDTSWMDGAPFPVLDSGAYQVVSNSETLVEMTSAVCPVSHLSVTRRISLKSAHSWTIDHAVTNHGQTARAIGIWSVMMIDTPAKIGAAMKDSAFDLVFGSAGALVSEHQGYVVADCSRKQEFKVGLPNPDGETLIRFGKDGPWMMSSVPRPKQGDSYAHQHPLEVFNSGDYDYCEAEWHSPQTCLLPGEAMRFQQEFSVWADQDSSNAPNSITINKEFQSCMS